MKKIITAGGIFSLLFFFLVNMAIAQSTRTQKQNENVTPATSIPTEQSYTEEGEVSESPERVTIESEQPVYDRKALNQSRESRNESGTKIYIYSGKHDGNNIINPDPKNKE